MEIILNIPDKVYNEIMEMCKYNNITIDDYIFNCTLDNFNIMKYGDLNEKLNINQEQPKIEKEEVVIKKKVGRPRKKKEEPNIEEKNIQIENIEEVKNNTNNAIIDDNKPKTIKRTRVLKTR